MPIELQDQRVTKHFITDHIIIDEYLPALGAKCYQLYSIYCRIASSHSKVFPSFRTIHSNTGFSFSTITKFNELLEELGLLRVIRRRSASGDRDNNLYILLEPKGLTPEQKKKYYPKGWEPILKSGGVTPSVAPQEVRFPQGATASVTPVLHLVEHGATGSEAQVLQPVEHIKSNSVVVSSLKALTTTAEALSALLDLLEGKLGKKVDRAGMEVILNSAIKKAGDIPTAAGYVASKIQALSFENKNDPMAFLHSAVQKNWKDYSSWVEKQAETERIEETKARWRNLPIELKIDRWLPAAEYRFIRKHNRKPNPAEIQSIKKAFAMDYQYDGISLSDPDPNFA